jgi:H+/Cl- antiporter ClcA
MDRRSPQQSARNRSRRPFVVTLLSGLVLILAGINLVRTIQALSAWDFLDEVLPFSPLYLVVTGLIWGLAGVVTAWWLWRGLQGAHWFTLVFLLLYSLYYWMDRVLMPGYAGRNNNWPFVAGSNLLLLVWSVWTFIRPKVRNFFEATDE